MILEPNVDGVPVPVPGPLSAPYWEGTRTGELRYQRCDDCGTANFGPGLRCSSCRSAALTWAASSGHGRIYSWTVVWRPQTPAFTVPYAPAIVRLDEGYDMVTAIVGCAPEAIVEDLAVAVEFHVLTDEITLPFFRPDAARSVARPQPTTGRRAERAMPPAQPCTGARSVASRDG